MWRGHPENKSAEAWKDLLVSMTEAVAIAEKFDLQLGVEPEVGNVVESATKARQLLDEMKSSRLKIVMDAANLFQEGQLSQMKRVLNQAFELLGRDIGIAHAKDLKEDGRAGDVPAGQGVLDYELYLNLLDQSGFKGPLILHGLTEQQVPEALQFIQSKLPRQQRLL